MIHIKRHIPNFITLLNLSCGCIAAVMAFREAYAQAFLFMLGAIVFDVLDGFAARLLKSYSDMGKELDSLADMVSFGFVPGVLMWSMGGDWSLVAFLITLFAALRLAKFNIDPRQHEVFYGLATTSCALFFGTLAFITEAHPDSLIAMAMANEAVRIVLVILFSFLMVCDLPMFSLKFKSWGFKNNALVYSFLLLSLLSIVICGVMAVPFIILAYVLLSVILKIAGK